MINACSLRKITLKRKQEKKGTTEIKIKSNKNRKTKRRRQSKGRNKQNKALFLLTGNFNEKFPLLSSRARNRLVVKCINTDSRTEKKREKKNLTTTTTMECNHQAQMLFFLDIEVLLRTLIKIIAMSEFILTIRVQVAGEKQVNML